MQSCLSFSEIRKIDENYAGYLSIASLFIIALLIFELFKIKKDEELSTETTLFAGAIFSIGFIFFLTINLSFKLQTQTFYDYAINFFFLGCGFWACFKITEKLEALKKNVLLHGMMMLISVVILFNSKSIMSYLSLIASKFISGALFIYFGLFAAAFLFFFVLHGIFFSGIQIVLKEYIWKRKIKNWYKNLNRN